MKNNQLAIVDGRAFTEKDMYSAIDTVIDNLNQTGDIHQATTALVALEKLEDVSGHAKARLLYGMWDWWTDEGSGTAEFIDYVESHSERTKRVTVDRYLTVQGKINSGDIPEDVATLPMRTLVPIAKTLSHGHKISRKQFDQIIKANNSREVEDILRGIKNKAPRKGSRQIRWERDGSLYTWKNNIRKFCGWWDREAFETDPDVREAITRMRDGGGVKTV